MTAVTVLDANYILRWFLGDVPEQAAVVERLLAEAPAETLSIDRVTLAELTYVLRGRGYDHRQIYLVIEELSYYPAVMPFSDEDTAALRYYAETTLDFEDCVLVALAEVRQWQIGSFDKKLLARAAKIRQ